jgi:Ca2+-binding EF-hand superfamily protein
LKNPEELNMNQEQILAAFKTFDANGDGLINLQGIV